MSFNLESLKEIVPFLSYYPSYKLLLCSKCFRAILNNLRIIKEHLEKHFKEDINISLSKEEKEEIYLFISNLEVFSLKESYNLIIQESLLAIIRPFQELNTLSNLYQCLKDNCFLIKQNKKNILRHLSKDHSLSNSLSNPLSNYYKVKIGRASCRE